MAEANSQPKRPRNGRNNNWDSRRGKSRRTFFEKNSYSSVVPMKTISLCSVCNQVENPKYKCPKCREAYCCIQCCRNHKERGCCEQSKEKETAVPPASRYLPPEILARIQQEPLVSEKTSRNIVDQDDDDDDLEEGWKITDAMIEAMEQSEWLKKELKDVGLRHLIMKINRAADVARRNSSKTEQEEELDQTKNDYPPFKTFIDKLLVLAGVLERHGEDENLDMNQWLEKEQDGTTATHLVLKPIDRSDRNSCGAKKVGNDATSDESVPGKNDNNDGSSDDDISTSSSS